MPISSTPCRAKDPDTCRYHGPERLAAEAAARGDWDAVLTLLLERDAHKDVRDAELAAFQAEFNLPGTPLPETPDLYTMSTKNKIAYLEEQILERDINFEDNGYGYANEAQMVDVAIHLVAKYTPADTVFDIAKKETSTELDFDRFFKDATGRFAGQIAAIWQDTSLLIGGERNLLKKPASTDWRAGFKHELAKALAERGELMSDHAGFYGWRDHDYVLDANRDKPNNEYNNRPFEVVSVLHVEEDSWDEFEGTFTDSSHHVGVSGWGVLSDGSVRRLRLEEEFGSLLRSITRG